MHSDVIIIGRGPAGISAALYAARANLAVTLLGRDGGALLRAERIDNYYGVPGISGPALQAAGEAQLSAFGVTPIPAEATDVSWEGEFHVTAGETYTAPAVILATGAQRKAPPIKGLDRLSGSGVSYCAVCDAFFFRGKAVAVLGSGPYALHEAEALLPVAGKTTLLTNGQPLKAEFPKTLDVINAPIAALEGEERLERVAFQDGSSLALDGLFVAVGVAGSGAFAQKLGVVIDGITTGLPGFYAAGDCTGGLMQVSTAVAEGAKAAMEAIAYVRSLKK